MFRSMSDSEQMSMSDRGLKCINAQGRFTAKKSNVNMDFNIIFWKYLLNDHRFNVEMLEKDPWFAEGLL